MDKQQAIAFIAKYPNAMSFVRKSHLEELSPLCEVHIEAVEAKKSDFHDLGSGTFYPHKELTDRIGNAAGISFAGDTMITKDSDGAIIGRAIPQELGPDGKMVQWAPANYEFSPEDRAEEEWLKGVVKKGYAEPSEAAKRLKVLEMKKVAVRRADTGARVAAIISAIGMPTGFKNIFNGTDTVVFLFSRVIVNTKNEMVMNRALDMMFASSSAIAGPSLAQKALASPPVSAQDYEESVSAVYETMDEPSAQPDPYEPYIQALKDYNSKYRHLLPSGEIGIQKETGQLGRFDKALENPQAFSLEQIKKICDQTKNWLETKKGVTFGGAAQQEIF